MASLDDPALTLPLYTPGPLSLSAEIIAVGTELLMGEVVNTNASYLSTELAKMGINVFFHTSVGDNPARIQSIFKEALTRSNILLVTGGLGPTDDDLTVATLAELFGTPMISDPDSEEQIRRFFITRDMPMSKTNLKQALRPVDGEAIENPMGTAPGLFWDVTEKVATQGWGSGPKMIFAFPGVPREMVSMWETAARPRLLSFLPEQSILVTRYLKFIGIGESMLAEKLRDLMAQESPTVSPYVGQAEVKIRIAVKAPDEATGQAQIAPVEAEILNRVGHYCYGADEEQLEHVIGKLLGEKDYTIGVAESCTGGLVSSRLTDVSGSSDYIKLNVVTYSNEAKSQMLNVSPETLIRHGAVSAEVAAEMAQGVVKLSGANVGLSLTGIAGPTGGSEEKPVGLVYIGLAGLTPEPVVKKISVNPKYSRQHIKTWFSHYALNFCRLYLSGLLNPDE